MRTFGTIVVAAIAACGLVNASPAGATFYQEVGDAGDIFHSQPIGPPGVDFTGIVGDIGGKSPPDPVDAYAFFYGGGALYARTFVNLGLDIVVPVIPGLFTATFPAIPTDPMQPVDPITPSYTNSVTGVAGWDLAAGNYIIEYSYSNDPPISSAIFQLNPDGNPTAAPALIRAPQVPQAAPEPATAALLALGLAAAAACALRRRSLART